LIIAGSFRSGKAFFILSPFLALAGDVVAEVRSAARCSCEFPVRLISLNAA
jgi:hypothetical protein